jgi:predicted glycosyltransferase
MAMSTRPTVLFHPPNHVGLGHINRLSAIAIALRQKRESVRSIFVVEGAGHVLLDTLGFPFVPLPSEHTLFATSGRIPWPEGERSTLSREISRAIIKSIEPRLVVFDCFSNAGFAQAVLENTIPVVLCLREMQDLQKYLRHVHDLVGHISHIVIAHEPGAFEVPEAIRMKSTFVGQIVRPMERATETSSKHRHFRVIITGGGGGYAGTFCFYNLAIKALLELRREEPAVTGRLITGPLFQDWSQLELGQGISVTPFEPDMTGAFSTADLVVSAAGYNASAELERLGIRTILVPADRQWDDQYARARRLAHKHPHFKVFTGSSPHDLASLMRGSLRETRDIHIEPSMNGAWKAAEVICALLEGGQVPIKPDLALH